MSTCRYRAGAVLLMAPLVLAACGIGEKPSASTRPASDDTVVSSLPSPSLVAAKLGVPFRSGSFDVTVTRVEAGVRRLDIADVAKSGGLKAWTPKNGQYVVVHLTARNVGNAPTPCSTSTSTLVDDAGGTYSSTVLLVAAPPVGQGLGADDLQPGISASGFIVFDVPTSAGAPATLMLQTNAYRAVTHPPSVVNLRS